MNTIIGIDTVSDFHIWHDTNCITDTNIGAGIVIDIWQYLHWQYIWSFANDFDTVIDIDVNIAIGRPWQWLESTVKYCKRMSSIFAICSHEFSIRRNSVNGFAEDSKTTNVCWKENNPKFGSELSGNNNSWKRNIGVIEQC